MTIVHWGWLRLRGGHHAHPDIVAALDATAKGLADRHFVSFFVLAAILGPHHELTGRDNDQFAAVIAADLHSRRFLLVTPAATAVERAASPY